MDDDLNDIPTKICKYDLDTTANDIQTCDICFNPWTTAGDHKIVSLKCGHVYGQKCIESWFHQTVNANCPICKRSFVKKDIRPLFLNIKTIALEDNTEFMKTVEELSRAKIELKKVEEECSQMKLMNKLMSIELMKISEENKRLLEINDLSNYQNSKKFPDSSQNASSINFQLRQKLQVSAIGGCRVMAYSALDNKICVSCPSSVRLVTGYGVRVVDVDQGKVKKYINLHQGMIRNIDFNPFYSTNLMLTCSLDKTVKVSNINSDSIVSSFDCGAPVWSCAWSNNNHIVYAGLANGAIEEIDNRNLSSPIKTIWTQTGGPILSMRYICANDYFKQTGLLVTSARGVTFLSNLAAGHHETQDLSQRWRLETLLMSSTYSSSIVSTALNDDTFHLMNMFRPSDQHKNVRYVFSSIGTVEDDREPLYASEIKSIFGSRTMDVMSRCCFLTDKKSGSYAVGANEETSSINVWNLNSDFASTTLYPKDVSRQKPVIDLCQYSSDPIAFAALNCENLYFYKQVTLP